MGYSSIFDIIGSIFIAGTLYIMVINMQNDISQMTYTDGSDLIVQTNITTVTRLLEKDFRLIAYCAKPDSFTQTSNSIVAAGAHNISFLADVNGDGTMDTVKYYVGSPSDLPLTPNPNDFPLYRQINSQPAAMYNVGLTQFDFAYFDWMATPKTLPITFPYSGVLEIQLTIMLKSPVLPDSLGAYSYWRQLRLSARNLMTR
ncbi:MAG: hypothetical protein ACHQQQ_12740 [Bacteroidota bacterium]